MIAPLMALAALGLTACDDPPQEQPAKAAPEANITEARRAAEAQVRARLRIDGEMRLRAIQVYRQQLPDTFAVC